MVCLTTLLIACAGDLCRYAVGSPHTWPSLLGALTWLVELLTYQEIVEVRVDSLLSSPPPLPLSLITLSSLYCRNAKQKQPTHWKKTIRRNCSSIIFLRVRLTVKHIEFALIIIIIILFSCVCFVVISLSNSVRYIYVG